MTALLDIIDDTFPANDDVGVPLLSTITILFDREMDEEDLNNNFFVEGPDTDQFIGPGLLMLEYPQNLSQGEVDDFLKSPGYRGIVQGTTTFTGIDLYDSNVYSGVSPFRTKLIFTPTLPFTPLTEYTAYLSDSMDVSGVTYTGIVTFSFVSGSGSVEEIPSTISSSVLRTTTNVPALATAGEFRVTSTNPLSGSVQKSTDLNEITIDFNKPIDPNSVTEDSITIFSEPATDHPNATAVAYGDLTKDLTISGQRIIVRF
jgi:hypothetical protein